MAPTDPLILILLSLLIGLVAGFIGGLLGVGGGVIMVPALVLVLGMDFHVAKAASLFAIFFLSLNGTYEHQRCGNVDRRMGVLLGITGMAGSLLGTFVSAFMETDLLVIIFGAVLLLSAVRFFVKIEEKKIESRLAVPLIGLGGGFIAGLLGLGGGIILVQGMVYVGVAIHMAVGTSLLAIIFNSLSGVIGHALLGYMDLMVAVPMTVTAVAGVKVGCYYCDRTEPVRLKRIFGVALAVVAVYMILRALGVIQVG